MEGYEDLPPAKKQSASVDSGGYEDLPSKESKVKVGPISNLMEKTKIPEESVKRNRALMLGLGTSLATPLGQIEQMVTPESTGELKGQETVFTTPQQLRKGLQKYGVISKLSPEEEKYAGYGELAPVAVLGGKALKQGLGLASDYVGGTRLGKALTTGYEAITGKATKEAAKQAARTTEAIRQTGAAGKTAAGARAEELSAAEFQKRARQESNLKKAQKKFMTAAEQERQDAAMKFADLKSPDPRIKDTATLGDAMQRRISGTETTRSARASQQASRDYGEYFEQAKGFENSTPRKVMMKKLMALSESPSAGSPGRKYAAEALNNLEKSTNAVGAEIEFKKYFQEASAPQQMGFGAEEQNASRVVSDIIGEALNLHAPKRIEARKTYKEFQTPLDAYETLFGRKGVKEEAKVPGKLEMMPTDYPARYFKNRDTIQVLRQQLAGDEAAVRKFANAHSGIELDGLNAQQAQSWLNKNKSWVDEVPGLNDRVRKYVQELSRSEQVVLSKEVQAGKLGEKKEKVVETGQATEQKIRDVATSQKKQIDDMLIKLNTADPEKSANAAKSMIDTLATMRDISGKPIMPPGSLNNLTMQMKMVDDAYGASAKAIELKRAIIIKTLGTLGLGYGLYQTSSYLATP